MANKYQRQLTQRIEQFALGGATVYLDACIFALPPKPGDLDVKLSEVARKKQSRTSYLSAIDRMMEIADIIDRFKNVGTTTSVLSEIRDMVDVVERRYVNPAQDDIGSITDALGLMLLGAARYAYLKLASRMYGDETGADGLFSLLAHANAHRPSPGLVQNGTPVANHVKTYDNPTEPLSAADGSLVTNAYCYAMRTGINVYIISNDADVANALERLPVLHVLTSRKEPHTVEVCVVAERDHHNLPGQYVTKIIASKTITFVPPSETHAVTTISQEEQLSFAYDARSEEPAQVRDTQEAPPVVVPADAPAAEPSSPASPQPESKVASGFAEMLRRAWDARPGLGRRNRKPSSPTSPP